MNRSPFSGLIKGVAVAITGLMAGGIASGAVAQTNVYRELILSIDVSGSVDTFEYDLQKNGWKNAFSDPGIKASLFKPEVISAGGSAIGVAQWSSLGEQTMAIPTMRIFDDASYNSFISQLGSMTRIYGGSTCVSCGMDVAINDILTNGFVAPAGVAGRLVVDLSGDGANNDGPNPLGQKAIAEANGIIINGLAIESPSLVTYYQDNVATMATAINGGTPAGFVLFADSFTNFETAAINKLGREMNGGPSSTAVPAGLPLFGVAAAFGSIRKMRQFSSRLQNFAKA